MARTDDQPRYSGKWESPPPDAGPPIFGIRTVVKPDYPVDPGAAARQAQNARALGIIRQQAPALGIATASDLGPHQAEGIAYGYPLGATANEISGAEDDKMYSLDAPERKMYAARGVPSNLDVAAADIEHQYGKLEDHPSWMNGNQYAKAGKESGLSSEQSRFLMSPERYQYMQAVGRTADLLRGLKDSPSQALHYWDKSDGSKPAQGGIAGFVNRMRGTPENPRLTRNDYADPNYQRFSGAAKGALEFLQDPTSLVAGYLRKTEIVPNAIRFLSESPEGSEALRQAAGSGNVGMVAEALLATPAGTEALARAKAHHDFYDRFRVGENEVLDLPEIPGESDADRTGRYAERSRQVNELLANLSAPSPQYVANQAFGGKATPAQAFALDTAISAIDPSLIGGILVGLPARMAGLSRSSVLRQLARQLPMVDPQELGARYIATARSAASAGTKMSPAEIGQAIYASTPLDLGGGVGRAELRPGFAPSRLPVALFGETAAQMAPEYAFSSGIHAATSPAERTYAQFFASPEDAEELDTEARRQASHIMEMLPKTRGPQSISGSRTEQLINPQSIEGFTPYTL